MTRKAAADDGCLFFYFHKAVKIVHTDDALLVILDYTSYKVV